MPSCLRRTPLALTATIALLLSAKPALAFYSFTQVPHTALDILLVSLIFLAGLLGWRFAVLRTREHLETERMEELELAVAERDAALESLEKSRETYRSLFDISQAGIFRSSLDGLRFLAANETLAEIAGYSSAEEFIRQAAPKEFYADIEDREHLLRELSAHCRVDGLNLTLLNRSGELLEVRISAILHRREQFIEGSVLNLTPIVTAERKLTEQARFIQRIVDALPIPFFYKDREGRYRLVNQTFCHVMSMERDEIEGKTVLDIYSDEHAQTYAEMDEILFKASGPATQRYISHFGVGETFREVVFNKEVLLDEDDNVTGVVGVITDITSHQRIERELRAKQAQLLAVINSAQDLIFYKTPDSVYSGCNTAYAEHHGLTPADIPGLTDFDLYPPETAEAFRETDRVILESLKPYRVELYAPFRSQERHLDLVKTPVITETGDVIGIAGVARDITERKIIEENLREAEARYRTVFMNAVEGIFVSTPDGQFLSVNPAMAELFGFDSPEQLIRDVHNIAEQLYVRPHDRQIWVSRVQEGETATNIDMLARRRDGENFWLSLSVRGVFNDSGELEYIEGIATDVSTRKATEADLLRRATTDPLTGLPNRYHLAVSLNRMTKQAIRSSTNIALLFIDLDGFKEVNDTHGHRQGDELLIRASERIQSRVRQADIVSRLHGDEFAVILWDVESIHCARKVAGEIRDALARPFSCGDVACSISASIGLVLAPEHGTEADDLLHKADTAMYRAKQAGKNRVSFLEDIVPGDC